VARLLFLGPTLAMDCASGRLHVDGQVWDLQDLDGRLVVAPRQARAAWPARHRVATGLAGTVGIAQCECGRDDPWLFAGDLEAGPATDGTR
jgi:hypothetical protein